MGMDGGSAKYWRDYHHPSFSSALLDEMYRSTDLDQQSTSTACKSRSMRYEAGHDLFSLNSTSSCMTAHDRIILLKPPKPIRVYQAKGEEEEYPHQQHQHQHQHQHQQQTKSKSKSKSKALNLYRDFKKQPISPGRRFATFLNSLFSTRNTNKPNYTTTTTNSNPPNSSIFSPSSLTTNNPSLSPSPSPSLSLTAKSTKMSSLRFVDQPRRHKSLHDQQQTTAINRNHHISEAARNLLKTYQKKVERFSKKRNSEYEHESDDDAGSDTSSDLFELHNLSPITTATATAIGIHKDLPLYETTQLI